MERNDNEDMKIVHDNRPGIGKRTFRIKFEKDAFRSDFIIGRQLPAASTAIYTPLFIKTIQALFIGVPPNDEELKELSKTHLAAAFLKEMKNEL